MKKAIRPANLFTAVMVWDTMRKKEESGERSRELQDRVEKKTAEITSKIDTAAFRASLEKDLSAFRAAVLADLTA